MTRKEEDQGQKQPSNEPQEPSILPLELVEYLRHSHITALLHGSDQGTIVIIKAPKTEIDSCRGTVPIEVRHELHDRPQSPVIRTTLAIYDQPDRPLRLECFTNVREPGQREDFRALANQESLYLFFFDEKLEHRLSKQVGYTLNSDIPGILKTADQLLSKIPEDQVDFDRAKADVMRETNL